MRNRRYLIDEEDDARAFALRRRHAAYSCGDGMCGADDCPRCRPLTFDQCGEEAPDEGENAE